MNESSLSRFVLTVGKSARFSKKLVKADASEFFIIRLSNPFEGYKRAKEYNCLLPIRGESISFLFVLSLLY